MSDDKDMGLHKHLYNRMNSALERWLPEQRLFLKSDRSTRFVRLRPVVQAVALAGGLALFGWAVLASSMLFIDGISSGANTDGATLSKEAFEKRLDELSTERDARAQEAQTAQNRFQLALVQVSKMQSALLASEERRRELETGIDVVQNTLRTTMKERDAARSELAALETQQGDSPRNSAASASEMTATVDVLTAALADSSVERDRASAEADEARIIADQIAAEKRLLEKRNDEIFTTLEGAVNVSMAPLDRMFKNAGVNPDQILEAVRKGYSGSGGPLMPLAFSSKGAFASSEEMRAGKILTTLDELNMYRMAVDKLPFAMPVKSNYRFTSPYGYRWGRLHAGVDLAGPVGTPIYAPADGVVTTAEVESGYGRVIKIRHAFGITTVYGHLSRYRVSVGQKVSRGELIGDMGNTGRSTGPHLHYEIRVGGSPTNPMTFIKAAKDVF